MDVCVQMCVCVCVSDSNSGVCVCDYIKLFGNGGSTDGPNSSI